MASSSDNYFCAPAEEWLPKIWMNRDVITASLISVEGATLLQPSIRHISGLEREIVASAPIVGRRMVEKCFDAEDPYFVEVIGPTVGAILAHWGNVPLFVCEYIAGLPLTPNGGDIYVIWQNWPPFIARLPDAKAQVPS